LKDLPFHGTGVITLTQKIQMIYHHGYTPLSMRIIG